MLAVGVVMICEQAAVLEEVPVGGVVAAGVDVNATTTENGIVQAMTSEVSLIAPVPPAHSVFLSSKAARIAWTSLRH